MDGGNAEQSLLYENRLEVSMSPSHQNLSDDEDMERDLEVMLYSQIHHEAPIDVLDSLDLSQQIVVAQDHLVSGSIDEVNDAHSPSVEKLPDISEHFRTGSNCRRSEFNKVGRRKASRYYDDHRSKQEPIFNIPSIPTKEILFKGKRAQRSKTLNTLSKSESNGRASLHSIGRVPKRLSADCSINTDGNSSKNLKSASVVKSSLPTETRNLTENNVEINKFSNDLNVTVSCGSGESDPCDHKDVPRENILPQAKNEADLLLKSSSIAQQENCQAATKQQQLHAQISQVVSSMLDDESCCVEDNELIATRASQASKTSNDNGWSVGMSWYDMSSSNFEVESVDSESLCSFPPQETLAPAETSINTVNVHIEDRIIPSAGIIVREEEHGKGILKSMEPSRYDLHLKHNVMKNDSHVQSDPDSEEDSIIEMHVPPKPKPVLVDVSDGDDNVVNQVQNEAHSKCEAVDDDVLFLCAHRKIRAAPVEEIVVCDDDFPFINKRRQHMDVISATMTNIASVNNNNVVKRRETKLNQSSEGNIRIQNNTQTCIEKLDKLSLWLHDPIMASRGLDHQKFLDKMGDDPGLWKMCPQDRLWIPSSPRGVKCMNCHEFGHKKKFCPQHPKIVKCHMCGTAGHRDSRCPQKMCLKCGKPNNIFTDRCKSCSTQKNKCKICQSFGHEWTMCPDMWRRYHLTTTPGRIIQPKNSEQCPPALLWCCNCARKGHLSHQCRGVQWRCESISPFVESYLTPAQEERRVRNNPVSASIILSEEDANILKSMEGDQFLRTLSTSLNLSVHLSLSSSFKSLSITGSTIDQEKARLELINWLTPRRKRSSSKGSVEAQKPSPESLSAKKDTKTHVDASPCNPHQQAKPIVKQPVQKVKQNIKTGLEQSIQASDAGIEQLLVISVQEGFQRTSEILEQPENSSQLDQMTSSRNVSEHKLSDATSLQSIQNEPKGKSPQPTGDSGLKKSSKACLPAAVDVASEMKYLGVPRTRLKLRRYLAQKLREIKNNRKENVNSIYSRILQFSKGPRTTSIQKTLGKLNQKLNTTLLGTYKLGPGRLHMEALQTILLRLGDTKHSTEDLVAQFSQHFVPIFSRRRRDDLKKLIEEYRCIHKMSSKKKDESADS